MNEFVLSALFCFLGANFTISWLTYNRFSKLYHSLVKFGGDSDECEACHAE